MIYFFIIRIFLLQEVEKKVKEYAISVTNLFNTGESKETINSYKNSVLKLLNIKKKPEQSTSNAN